MKNKDVCRPGERLDDLQLKDRWILQNPKKFCFGLDAVLLSDYATVRTGDCVLDLGTGTGIVPILMEAKTEAAHFTGLDIQEESIEMARRSVQYNGTQDKIEMVWGDLKEAAHLFGAASFDVVTTNPPYMDHHHGLVNPDEPKAIARHEILCTLEDVIREGTKVLKTGGRFCMVHRPHRLPEMITLMKSYRLEPKRMRLVHPYVDKEPNMVLIEAVRGGKPMLKVDSPLIVYKKPGEYTDEILKIYHKKGEN